MEALAANEPGVVGGLTLAHYLQGKVLRMCQPPAARCCGPHQQIGHQGDPIDSSVVAHTRFNRPYSNKIHLLVQQTRHRSSGRSLTVLGKVVATSVHIGMDSFNDMVGICQRRTKYNHTICAQLGGTE